MFAESFFLSRNLYFRNLIFQILLSYAMSLLGQHVTTYTKQWAFKSYQTYLKFYIVRPCCRRFGKLFLGTVIPAFFRRKVYVFWLNKYSFMNFSFPGKFCNDVLRLLFVYILKSMTFSVCSCTLLFRSIVKSFLVLFYAYFSCLYPSSFSGKNSYFLDNATL